MGRDTKTLMEPLFQYAKKTPFYIAPERESDLANEIFTKARWKLTGMGGVANFHAYPEETKVAATYAGLASLWCLSYAVFHISDVASRSQRAACSTEDHVDIGASFQTLRIKEHLDYASSLFQGDSEWPNNILPPDSAADFDTPEGRVNNAFYGALSWILLHEIGHVHHQHLILIPVDQRLQQEFQADNFATHWILDQSGSGLQREFRVLMVCVALSWLFLNEKTLGQGADHPPTIIRFQEAISLFDMGERSPALENAAYIFKAIFFPTTQAPTFDTPKQSFEWVANRLSVIFPR